MYTFEIIVTDVAHCDVKGLKLAFSFICSSSSRIPGFDDFVYR